FWMAAAILTVIVPGIPRRQCAAGAGWLTTLCDQRPSSDCKRALARRRPPARLVVPEVPAGGMSGRLAVLAACARVPADELERSVWRVLARPGSWQTCAGSSAGSGPDFLPALNRQRGNDQPGQAPSADARRAGRPRRPPGTHRAVGPGRQHVAHGRRAGGTLAASDRAC